MAKLNLIRIAGSSYCASGRWAVGVYMDPKTKCAVLIDSGASTSVAREVDHAVKEYGGKITAIITTHGHEVQCRGIHYFKDQYPNIKIYSTHQTGMYMQHMLDESDASRGGDSIKSEDHERNHLITDYIPYEEGSFQAGAIQLQIVTLPGHCAGMIGVITPDDVVYCSDALFGYHTLSKQKLLYYTNIADAKTSIRKLLSLSSEAYVLYHGGCIRKSKIMDLANQHLSRINELSNVIYQIIQDRPITLESIIEKVMRRYGIEQTMQQYEITSEITRAHVTELRRTGQILPNLFEGYLYFKGSTQETIPDTDDQEEHIIESNANYVSS